jgi:SET domain-containing protein
MPKDNKEKITKKYKIKKSITGLGLFASLPYKKGEFVIEYIGVALTPKQADEKGGQYLFEVNSRKTIDGSVRYNTARYINHSCSPNCEADVVKGKIIITTLRAIEPGEELTYDYGKEFFNDYIKPKGCKCSKCILKAKNITNTK